MEKYIRSPDILGMRQELSLHRVLIVGAYEVY
jgi:hypothetical protein